jgi:hypothetical protein
LEFGIGIGISLMKSIKAWNIGTMELEWNWTKQTIVFGKRLKH